ncbi:DUF4173 domain-containing protein [Sinanaerobacter sp. ZZT-01]|uniref:DUF4153 domain-containing protein n=1 Tax=Sinanaerobacter sp. ZZT-01 TaxID=3111540 RepID=UPI002D776E82|nr:DUF4173 domain-containing protein [Sinanaerobacter sp. ZZT-01]WRR94054.1 DUF4173 domain-containing protein [Sinanaerobacter sp. ZZT-01]
MDEILKVKEEVRVLTEVKPKKFEGKDIGFALFMPVIGFLYWHWIGFSDLGLSVTCFVLLFCLSVGLYMYKSGFPQTKQSIPYLILTLISALPFFLFDNLFLKLLNVLFVTILAVYWVCVTTKRRLEGRLSVYILWDLITQFFFIPFSNFTCQFAGLKQMGKKSQRGRNLFMAALGLLFFTPILIWVMQLLMNADAVFEAMIGKLSFTFFNHFLNYLVQFLLGIPVSCYLYGLLYGDATGRSLEEYSTESVKESILLFQFAPSAAIFTALTALNAIYLLFFFSQGTYLLSAFDNILPQSMTYAEYARRGFFELCTVSGINLMTIAVAYLIMKRSTSDEAVKGEETKKDKENRSGLGLKIEISILSVFTLLLILTAISKMGMYIHYYGLTLLRVYTTWFMILLFAFFCIILLRQFIRFEAGKAMVISFIVCFLILSFGNVDGQIAKYNIERYQQGTLERLDIASFYRLSSATAPYLSDLYLKEEDTRVKWQIRKILMNQPWDSQKGYKLTLQNYNYQLEQARKEFEKLGI